MENISLVTWSDLYVMDPTLFLERGLGVELTNIHEMAHTYFGDLIVIRHFEHVWLKESWATYFGSFFFGLTISKKTRGAMVAGYLEHGRIPIRNVGKRAEVYC